MNSVHLVPLNLKNKQTNNKNTLKILLRIFNTQQRNFFHFCSTELKASILFHEFLHFFQKREGREVVIMGKELGEREWEGRVGTVNKRESVQAKLAQGV